MPKPKPSAGPAVRVTYTTVHHDAFVPDAAQSAYVDGIVAKVLARRTKKAAAIEKDREEFVHLGGIRERGWTRTMVDRLLGVADR